VGLGPSLSGPALGIIREYRFPAGWGRFFPAPMPTSPGTLKDDLTRGARFFIMCLTKTFVRRHVYLCTLTGSGHRLVNHRTTWKKGHMAKDYYLTLGLSSDATEDEIKSAYRREAKRCHPDSSGEDSRPFLAIREAYEVLADPQRRRAYDQELAREQKSARGAPPAVGPEPLCRKRPPVEPLVPRERTGDEFSISPFSYLIQELFGPRRSSPAPQEIHVEVSLTRGQALRGGRIRVWVPVQVRCPACRGRGASGFYRCQHCLGSGAAVDEVPVDVTFPGGLADGARGNVPLNRPGMRDMVLVLHFRADEQV